MTAALPEDQAEDGPEGKKPAKGGSERRCIAPGESQPKAGLIRFAVGPDGTIGPDLAEKLPGRGIWVTGTRKALELAIAKKAFRQSRKTASHCARGAD